MSVPAVPYSAFANLAGATLAEDLRRLSADPVLTGLVLFSDVAGEQLAILPLGPGQAHRSASELAGAEIEGLRPLCALHLRDAAPAPSVSEHEQELARLDESLRARERYIAECEQRLADAGQALSEREAMLEQREQMLISKERDFFRRGGDLARQA